MNIEHCESLAAWKQVVAILTLRGRTRAWISPTKQESNWLFSCECDQSRFCDFPKVFGPDGSVHVCAKQCDFPWPHQFDILRLAPVQTPIVPSGEWASRKLIEAFMNLALSVRDPFVLCGCELEERVNQVVQVVAYRLSDEWVSTHGASAPLLALSAEHVAAARKLCKGLYVEVLDKNPSSFAAMCPYLAQQIAA